MITDKIFIPKQIIWLTILTVVLVLMRVVLFRSGTYNFLIWNVFLAFLPFMVSSTLLLNEHKGKLTKKLFVIGGILWLLFFPNTFYLITDLMHIGNHRDILAMYDIFMLFGAALAGLVLGVYSLFHIEQILERKYPKYAMGVTILVMFLTSLGIYLGRFLRFNSWDIFSMPVFLVKEAWSLFSRPVQHIDVYVYVVLFSFFIYMSYNAWKETVMKE